MIALEKLFDWIEINGFYVDSPSGRSGFLYPPTDHQAPPGDDRLRGTWIRFAADGNANLKYWFRSDALEINERLCVFAETGGDGSMAAFWLDENGSQKIVHLGSGSGSTMVCTLAKMSSTFSGCLRSATMKSVGMKLFANRHHREDSGFRATSLMPAGCGKPFRFRSRSGEPRSSNTLFRWTLHPRRIRFGTGFEMFAAQPSSQ